MIEGKYLVTREPGDPNHNPRLPREWLKAVKAVLRLASEKDRPQLNYLEVEYHKDVTFMAATNGWAAIVAEMPGLDGASGAAHIPTAAVKAWIKSKGESDLVHDTDAGFPDIRGAFPGNRKEHDGKDLGLNVKLLHDLTSAMKDVRTGEKFPVSVWQFGGQHDQVYIRTMGALDPKMRGHEDDTSFLIHALLMPVRIND